MYTIFLNLQTKELYSYFKKNIWIFFTLLSFLPGINILYGIDNQSTGMDANGSIVIAWQENTSLGTEIKASALPFSSPSWEIPVILSNSQIASLPVLVVAANGADTFTVAIWIEVVAGTAHLYGAMRPSLIGSWTTSVLLSNGIEDVFGNYQLVLNSTGNIVATWTSFEAGNPNVRSSIAMINLLNIWGVPTTINL